MANLSDELSVRQAYFCMFEYLRRHYARSPSEELGAMLGALSVFEDGGSADPAALADFLESVETVVLAEGGGGYDEAAFKVS